MLNKDILIIFAKASLPGKVKTRMMPYLSMEECVKLNQCLLDDTFEMVNELTDVNKYIAYTPPDQKSYFEKYEKEGFEIFPQSEGDLGQRLTRAIEPFLVNKSNRVVVIGSDSPSLPIQYIRYAYQQLEQTEAIIGPTKDGGYYLIGLSKWIPEIFQNIDWSTEKVFQQTADILQNGNIQYSLLPCWHDLDTKEDLLYFYQQWGNPKEGNQEKVAVQTRQFIYHKIQSKK